MTMEARSKKEVGARTPAEIGRLFMEAFNAHDVDALVELYETDAVLVPQAGQRATGRKEIREGLTGFVSAFNSIELSAQGIVEQGDTALIYPVFTLRGTDGAGAPTTVEGRGTEVVRRQHCGSWMFAIDDPFSTA
jgi:uncharacterized protein (TIGR02246 family)